VYGCETMLLYPDAMGRVVIPRLMNRPILAAAAAGLVDIVAMLCAAKANLNLTTALDQLPGDREARYCATPLMAAARAGHVAVVKVLLGAGAKKSVKDSNGQTPWKYVRQQRKEWRVAAAKVAASLGSSALGAAGGVTMAEAAAASTAAAAASSISLLLAASVSDSDAAAVAKTAPSARGMRTSTPFDAMLELMRVSASSTTAPSTGAARTTGKKRSANAAVSTASGSRARPNEGMPPATGAVAVAMQQGQPSLS
jgi:hypothetical protein